MRIVLVPLLAGLLVMPARTTAAELEAARQPIEALYAVLVECLKNADELGLDGRRAKIAPAVSEGYDLPFMAKKILGRHWRTLDEASQQRWVSTFGGLTAATYAEQMTGFTGQVFEVLKVESSQRGTALVYSQVVTPGDDPIAINYRMRPDGESWRIIDVYLNGTVSELALRRSEYAAVLQRDGFEKLVASIDAKIASGQMAGETMPASAAQ
ncbi:MAG: ABC transporter substrate-binding protein [Myxococcota bacterium]